MLRMIISVEQGEDGLVVKRTYDSGEGTDTVDGVGYLPCTQSELAAMEVVSGSVASGLDALEQAFHEARAKRN